MSQQEIIDFKVAVDIREALRELASFQAEQASLSRDAMNMVAREMKANRALTEASLRALEDRAKATDRLTETTDDLSDAQRRAAKEEERAAKEAAKAAKESEKATKESEKSKLEAGKEAARLAKEAEKAAKDAEKAAKEAEKSEEEKIELLKKERDARWENARLASKKSVTLSKEMRSLGEGLKDPLEKFMSRDFKGLVESSAVSLGKGLARSATYMKVGGRSLDRSGRGAGGASRFMRSVAGGSLKGAGKLLGGLGALIGKLGGFASAFKMALDTYMATEKIVKEFNKGILTSASNMEFLAQGGSKGMANLKDSMDAVTDAAHDFQFNNSLGITAQEHQQVIGVLTQEGVALQSLQKEADRSGVSMKDLSKSIVASGVAYSRALGVPLAEVSQMQAQLITETGASMQTVKGSFDLIARASAESGIQAGRFFQMIKGASQDLMLWNFQLENAVETLSDMGKVLSPESAQKFFNTVAKGFKDLDRKQLTQKSVIIGSKFTKEVNERTKKSMEAELAKIITEAGAGKEGLDADTVTSTVKGGDSLAIHRLIMALDKDKQAAALEKSSQLTTVKQASKGSNEYEQGYALRWASTADTINVLQRELLAIGKGDLLHPEKMDIGAVAQARGMSVEQVQTFSDMLRGVTNQRKMLMADARAKGGPEGEAAVKAVEAMTDDDILNQMGKSMLPKSKEELDKELLQAAKTQGQYTQTLEEKFSNFSDWAMVKLYRLFEKILKAIRAMNPFGDKEKPDAAELSVGKEGENLGKVLQSEEGLKKVSSTLKDSGLSGSDLMDMARKAGNLSKDQLDKLHNETISSTYRFQNGSDPLKALRSAGIDPASVLIKSLWSDNTDAVKDLADVLGDLTEGELTKLGKPGPVTRNRVPVDRTGKTGNPFAPGATVPVPDAPAADPGFTNPFTAPANATGGTVTGIANGMAIVASQGEGLASVGKGEKIVPAGSSSAVNVQVAVNGIGGQDLKSLIESKVVEGIREYKRRERLG